MKIATDHEMASLDVLRGFAISFVILAHFTPSEVPFARSITVALANLGVILFFFLSGYLMDRTFARDRRFWPYLIRRGFRILPMYWLSIALILVLERSWSLGDVVANATFTAPALRVGRMSGVYWTLYIEVVFYALIPFLWLLGPRVTYSLPYVVVGAYLCGVVAHVPVSSAPFYLIYCFLGMQFSLWKRDKLSSIALMLSTAIVVIGSSTIPIVSPFLGLAPLICASFLLFAIQSPFHLRAVEFLGNVSYSWYLLHAIIGYEAVRFALAHGLNSWSASCLGIVTSLVASVPCYLIIERPAISFGKNLTNEGSVRRSALKVIVPNVSE